MKKKILITFMLLIIAFVSTSFVSGDYTKIYDKWQAYDTGFTVDGIVYKARINTIQHDTMRLTVNDVDYLLTLYECKDVDTFKYCFKNISYDREEATIADDGNMVPAVQLVLWQDKTLSSLIKIKNTFTPFEYELKETEMEVLITNDGTTHLENTVFTIFIPKNITITNPDDFTLKENQLIKKLNLGPEKSVKYNFKFIPKEYGTHNINYNYNYTSEKTQKSVKGTTSVIIKSPYELILPKLGTNYDVTDSVRFPVTIKNNHPTKELIIKKITIKGPIEYEYGFLSGLTSKGSGVFEGEGIIKPQKHKDYLITINPVYAGTFKILVDLDMELEGKPLTINKNVTIKSDIKDFNAKIYFDKTSALPGEKVKLTFYYYNSHYTNSLKEADVTVNSSLFTETFTIGDIPPRSQNNLLLKNFEIPARERDEKAQFRAELKFKTESGQIIRKNYTETINIAGTGKILQLTQKINKKTTNRGDEVIVELKAKNLLDQTYQNVVFQEILAEKTETIGETYKMMTFAPMEEKIVYVYKLFVPLDYEYTKYNITSTARIDSLLYQTSISSLLTINETTKPLPIINQTPEKNIKKINNSAQPPEKKPNFIVKIFKSIEAFFDKIFSKRD